MQKSYDCRVAEIFRAAFSAFMLLGNRFYYAELLNACQYECAFAY